MERYRVCPDCEVGHGFDLDLTNPHHAYLIGLAQTDGSLSVGPGAKGSFKIELPEGDADILYALQALIPYYSSISFRQRVTNFGIGKSAVFQVNARRFRNGLVQAGVPVGRKSKVVGLPPQPFSDMDYFRGLIDGDGSLGYSRTDGWPFISLATSSDAIAEAYIDFLCRVTTRRKIASRNSRDGLYNIMVNHGSARRLAALLYPPGALAMSRKAVIAAEIVRWRSEAEIRRARAAA